MDGARATIHVVRSVTGSPSREAESREQCGAAQVVTDTWEARCPNYGVISSRWSAVTGQ